MRTVTSLLLISPLFSLFAVASPSPVKRDLEARTYGNSKSQSCGGNQFSWGGDCCQKGGPSKKPNPPQGLDCPNNWYWNVGRGQCYPNNPNPPTPTCSNSWKWDGSRSCCKKSTPPPPPPPPPPQPSPKPGNGYGGGKNYGGGGNGNGNGGYNGGNNGGHGGGNNGGYNGGNKGGNNGGYGGGGRGWKRSLDWDNSFCPSGLDTCPILVGGKLTTDSECIDTQNEVTSCGGCTSLGKGTDCSKIPNATASFCQEGTCIVDACANGFKPASNDLSCIPL